MKEIFKNIIIPNNIKKIKIDIGLSYNAPVTQKLLEHDDDVFVFGFEPNPESVNTIINQDKDYGFPVRLNPKYLKENRCYILPIALSDVEKEQQMDFYICDNDPGCSSIFSPHDSRIKIKNKIQVPVFSLFHFFNIFDWNRFNYIEWLKIDAQGSDEKIIKGAKEFVKNIAYITVEADGNQYSNCKCSINNIEKFLKKYDFIRVQNKNLSDPTFFNLNFKELENKVYMWQ